MEQYLIVTGAVPGGMILAGFDPISIVVSVVISFVFSKVSSALFGKPKSKQKPASRLDSGSRTEVIRSSNQPRRVVYGEQMLSGALIYAATSYYAKGGEKDGYLHLVIALADHEVEAIDDIFVNDRRVPTRSIGSDGEVTEGDFFGSPDGSYVRIKKHLGAADQAADSDLVSELDEWTSEHRLRGIAYVYIRFLRNRDMFATGIPNVRAVVRGKKVFDPRDSATRYSTNPVLCIRDALIDELDIGVSSSEVNDTINAAQATVCDERVSLTSLTDIFTVDDTADDRLILSTTDDAHRWKTGDKVAIANSEAIPDPPLGLSEGDYYYIRLDDGRFKLAATYQEALEHEAVTLSDAGSGTHTVQLNDQVRYDCNGAFDKDKTPLSIIEDMNTAMAGVTIWAAGQYEIYAGGPTATAITLTESDLRGPIEVRAKQERRELFNRVTGEFINPDNFWQATDFPPIENAIYVVEDGGDTLSRDIELPFTTDFTRAQRLAKIHLEKSRQGITVQMPCKLTVLTVRVWDTVLVTVDYLGWSSKKFRVLSVKFADELGGVDLTLQEEANESYNWNAGDATIIDPAPNTNLPNPFDIGVVSNLTLESGSEHLLLTAAGTVISRINASWTEPSTGWVDRYEIQYKKSADAAWTTAGMAQKGQTDFYIAPVQDETEYDVRVRVISTNGGTGAFVTVTNHRVVGKTEAPAGVDTFTVVRLADGTRRFSWTQDPVPPDVRSGGGYRLKYSPNTAAPWGSMVGMHTGLLIASPWETNELTAGTYKFGIVSVDSTGNESTSPLYIIATLGDPRLRDALYQSQEHEQGWPGTKTDCFVNLEGWLEARGDETWNDLPDEWDDLESSWLAIVANKSPITYETEVIDLGTDLLVTGLVSTEGSGSVVTDWKTGTDADGAPVGIYGSLSPVRARYIRIRVTVTGDTPYLETLSIILDGERVIEDFEDINTATHSAPWFERIAAGHVKVGTQGGIAAISLAQISALQSVGGAWSWELISKNESVDGKAAAEFKIRNAAGALADATIDVTLKGPKA